MTNRISQNEQTERVNAISNIPFGEQAVQPSVFHALEAPCITPIEYLKRLARYSFCSTSVFVAAFLYLDRIAKVSDMKLVINSLSLHRLLLTAVLLATKVVDDVLYDNAHFAKVGGLDVKELNMLEIDMLKLLKFKLFITQEEFEEFEMKVLAEALSSEDDEYCKLKGRLRNVGFGMVCEQTVSPPSPSSTMDVSAYGG